MLDHVRPQFAAGRSRRFCGETRLHEAGWQGTRTYQHGPYLAGQGGESSVPRSCCADGRCYPRPLPQANSSI